MRQHTLRLALLGGAAAVVLAGGSTAAMALGSESFGSGNFPWHPTTSFRTSPSCTAPALAGTVVDVELTDMGAAMHRWAPGSRGHGGMMGGGMMGGSPSDQLAGRRPFGQMMEGAWRGGMMQVRLSRHQVPGGTVFLRVFDAGAMEHELVVLPLASGARVGQRNSGAEGTVDEHASVGEVSNNCGRGAGEGLQPGGTGWTTLQLRPGRYELVCNLPGHYAAGMFAELDVTP